MTPAPAAEHLTVNLDQPAVAELRAEIQARQTAIAAGRRPRPIRAPASAPPAALTLWPPSAPASWPARWAPRTARQAMVALWAVADRTPDRWRRLTIILWALLTITAAVVSLTIIAGAWTIRALCWPIRRARTRRHTRQTDTWTWHPASGTWHPAPTNQPTPRQGPSAWTVVAAITIAALTWAWIMAAIIAVGAGHVAERKAAEAEAVDAP